MTHCIKMIVKLKDWDDVKEIRQRIVEDEEESAMPLYYLKDKKNNGFGNIEPSGGLCPFIFFPENKKDNEDGYYYISVDTGSHCSWFDTHEILYMWTFWYYFKQEIESYGIEFSYRITEDSEDNNYNLAQAWKRILKESSELKKDLLLYSAKDNNEVNKRLEVY